ncbi:uncharacterized protein GLRG_01870 [Colletotrichum graminicola M1.001]|uniref:Uncharacterized protein n=1 Tax=Colletotrichum graminicola (strain M1.001 / M2 / FGSC 10212) TaxID=645133 RepID=E3Q9J6_COLGM|nr:uncharacterized protein GLRG_01870 [Colletotrichum graminicola M1.001]EFQ27375.1 hypothetical protein GLRG_01870 [Colletotrichum graminicola M1.001]
MQLAKTIGARRGIEIVKALDLVVGELDDVGDANDNFLVLTAFSYWAYVRHPQITIEDFVGKSKVKSH